MNGEGIGDYNPNWMESGGISGGEETQPRYDDYNSYQDSAWTQYYPSEDAWRRSRRRRDPGSRRQWNTTVTTRQNKAPEGGCI